MSSASLLSMLPKPMQPIPEDSFNDRILLLLAAVASSDGILTYRAYQLVQEAAKAIFGERALHAELQAKLHHALLHPPHDAASIAKDMANQAEVHKVSATFVESMLKALASIASHAERIDPQAQSLVQAIEWAFRKSHLERSAGHGFGLGINVGESLGTLYRMAANVLPSRKSTSPQLTPETQAFNKAMAQFTASLERIAWTLDDQELQNELHAFRKMLRDQPFKVVIVGERKRGKSSLINALVGQSLSPMRESTPETATVVSFHYSPSPEYSVQFLDSSQFSRLEDYLEHEEGNLLLTRKVEAIRQGIANGTFIPDTLLSGITCWDDLADYISLDGRFSDFVAKVSIGLPLEGLQHGVELVDTPGLNDTDRFHDYLAYEESLEADCLLFVMDARDPGSHSELSLLRKLTHAGRPVQVIGVLTNRDKLNDAASLAAAREQAQTVLLEACRGTPVQVVDVVAINTRQAVHDRCHNETAPVENTTKGLRALPVVRTGVQLGAKVGSLAEDLTDGLSSGLSRGWNGLGRLGKHVGQAGQAKPLASAKRPLPDQAEAIDHLVLLLQDVMTQDQGKEAYRAKVTAAHTRIVQTARDRLDQHVAQYRASLPSPELLSMLDAHATQLSKAALMSLEQARQVVEAAAQDLEAWDQATAQALERFQETLVLRMMDAVNRKVVEAGSDFAKDSLWREFETGEGRALYRQAVDTFLEEQRDVLHHWEEKLRLFAAHMDNFSRDCLARLAAAIDGVETDNHAPTLRNAWNASNSATHFLVQTHKHMKQLALFTSGVTVGRLTSLGAITLLATASNILTLATASPLAVVVVAAVTGTAGMLYHLGREEKRKAALLDKKRKEAEAQAARIAAVLREELQHVRTELGQAYECEIKRGFAPALESLFQQSVHLRLFLEVMQTIRNDVAHYEAHVQEQLAALPMPTLPHGTPRTPTPEDGRP